MQRNRRGLGTELPRELRKNSTDAELELWRHLRAHRFDNLKFRRQHRLGAFIVDFYCDGAKLAIEVDGGGHGDSGQAQQDEERTRRLERMGVRILRVWNNEVFQNLDGVLATIFESARRRRRST